MHKPQPSPLDSIRSFLAVLSLPVILFFAAFVAGLSGDDSWGDDSWRAGSHAYLLMALVFLIFGAPVLLPLRWLYRAFRDDPGTVEEGRRWHERHDA